MIRLYGRRVMLRPLVNADFATWSEVRIRNGDWLLKWEPAFVGSLPDPSRDRNAFELRIANRERERQLGAGYGFGMFVDSKFAGEINLNNVVRGAFQSTYVGYWIDEARAGQSYMPEAVVTIARFAFDELKLHLGFETQLANGRCPQMLGARCSWTSQSASSISRPPWPYSTWKPEGVSM